MQKICSEKLQLLTMFRHLELRSPTILCTRGGLSLLMCHWLLLLWIFNVQAGGTNTRHCTRVMPQQLIIYILNKLVSIALNTKILLVSQSHGLSHPPGVILNVIGFSTPT